MYRGTRWIIGCYDLIARAIPMAESDCRAKAALPEAGGASRTAASNPQMNFFKAAEIDVSVPMHEAVYRVMKAIEFGPRTVRE